jgi:1,5-anhydro-D-fructose reductase (1,5-anhydro-D-mannitol-forming)
MAKKTDRVRVAVLGAALFSEQGHIPGVQSHPHADMVALFSRDLSRAQEMAGRCGVQEATDDLDGLLARDDIDAVTIVSSNDQHHPYTMAALRHGKHVLCEKPMALDARQAREMTLEAQRRGLVNQIAFTFRFTYCLEEMRRRVAAGEIGAPYFIEIQGQWFLSPAAQEAPASWRDDPSLYGAGHLGEMGSHFIDTVNFVCGPTSGFISEVAASTYTGRRPAGKGATVDLASFLVRTEGGLSGQVLVSRVTPPPVSYSRVHAEAPQRGHMGYVTVTGDEGALKATFTRGEVEALQVVRPGGRWEPQALPEAALDGKPHGVERMVHAFIDAIRGTPSDSAATFEDGYRCQAAMDAVVAADRSRRWEPVPVSGERA